MIGSQNLNLDAHKEYLSNIGQNLIPNASYR